MKKKVAIALSSAVVGAIAVTGIYYGTSSSEVNLSVNQATEVVIPGVDSLAESKHFDEPFVAASYKIEDEESRVIASGMAGNSLMTKHLTLPESATGFTYGSAISGEKNADFAIVHFDSDTEALESLRHLSLRSGARVSGSHVFLYSTDEGQRLADQYESSNDDLQPSYGWTINLGSITKAIESTDDDYRKHIWSEVLDRMDIDRDAVISVYGDDRNNLSAALRGVGNNPRLDAMRGSFSLAENRIIKDEGAVVGADEDQDIIKAPQIGEPYFPDGVNTTLSPTYSPDKFIGVVYKQDGKEESNRLLTSRDLHVELDEGEYAVAIAPYALMSFASTEEEIFAGNIKYIVFTSNGKGSLVMYDNPDVVEAVKTGEPLVPAEVFIGSELKTAPPSKKG